MAVKYMQILNNEKGPVVSFRLCMNPIKQKMCFSIKILQKLED